MLAKPVIAISIMMRELSDMAAHAQVFAIRRRIAEPASESDLHIVGNPQDAMHMIFYFPAAKYAQDLHANSKRLRRCRAF